MADNRLVIVHFKEGDIYPDYHFYDEDVTLIIIDDNALGDRYYHYRAMSDRAEIDNLIPADAEIGHCEDDRHEAVAHVIRCAIEDRPALSVVKQEAETNDQ